MTDQPKNNYREAADPGKQEPWYHVLLIKHEQRIGRHGHGFPEGDPPAWEMHSFCTLEEAMNFIQGYCADWYNTPANSAPLLVEGKISAIKTVVHYSPEFRPVASLRS